MSGLVWAHSEQDIKLTEVPAKVIHAAQEAKPGIEMEEAKRIDGEDRIFYELEGNLRDIDYEFLITEDGQLIEMEEDD